MLLGRIFLLANARSPRPRKPSRAEGLGAGSPPQAIEMPELRSYKLNMAATSAIGVGG
jgi:hypothetical protein